MALDQSIIYRPIPDLPTLNKIIVESGVQYLVVYVAATDTTPSIVYKMDLSLLEAFYSSTLEKFNVMLKDFQGSLTTASTTIDSLETAIKDIQLTIAESHSGTADFATNAGHANTADYATEAGSANHSNTADSATTANTADYATLADTANSANHSNTADTATNANHANIADTALSVEASAISPSLMSNTVLKTREAGTSPYWGQVDLETDVGGTLPISNGGTGATTAQSAIVSLGLSQVIFSVDNLSPDSDRNVQTKEFLTAEQFADLEDPIGSGKYPYLSGKRIIVTTD